MSQTQKLELIKTLLDAYSDSEVMPGLIRALGVFILDERHIAFDPKAEAQALRALNAAAEYAGREVAR